MKHSVGLPHAVQLTPPKHSKTLPQVEAKNRLVALIHIQAQMIRSSC